MKVVLLVIFVQLAGDAEPVLTATIMREETCMRIAADRAKSLKPLIATGEIEYAAIACKPIGDEV